MTLLPRIIPCLDVRDGRVVKGIRFQGLRDAGDPVECARNYADQGADELCLLDVSATLEGRQAAVATVAAVRREIGIPLTVGGGVRSVGDASDLLQAGADKVAVNTAAVTNPDLIDELATRFGTQCTVVAVDASSRNDRWTVVIKSGSEDAGVDVLDWLGNVERRGAGEVLLTSWDRDGTRSGYDLALLREARRACGLPIIASGGAAGSEHLAEALAAGADAVLAASIFHDGEQTVGDVKAALRDRGVEVRS